MPSPFRNPEGDAIRSPHLRFSVPDYRVERDEIDRNLLPMSVVSDMLDFMAYAFQTFFKSGLHDDSDSVAASERVIKVTL